MGLPFSEANIWNLTPEQGLLQTSALVLLCECSRALRTSRFISPPWRLDLLLLLLPPPNLHEFALGTNLSAELATPCPTSTEFIYGLILFYFFFTFNVLFNVRILWSFSFMDGFLHRFTKDFLSSFLVEGRRSPRGDRLACSNDL